MEMHALDSIPFVALAVHMHDHGADMGPALIAALYSREPISSVANIFSAGIRADILQKLTAYPPSKTSWEVGGAANFMIAAARLGQRVGCLGQLGNDVFGDFFRSVMLVRPVLVLTTIEMRAKPASDISAPKNELL
jgi:hypothetical protein